MRHAFSIRSIRFRMFMPVLVFFFTALMPGCESLKKGLEKLVEIEYDQRLNFQQYEFDKYLPYGGGGESNQIYAKGVWLVYHICTIKNEKSKAQPFNFNLSKFYVEYGGQQFHPKQFGYGDLIDPPLGGAAFPVFYEKFREEVFTAPNTEVIPKNTSAYLSISWRFAILVSSSSGGLDNKVALDLRYDNSGGESLLLTGRGWPPDALNKATKSNLAVACRPKK